MKIISNENYEEYQKLKGDEKLNEFMRRGYRANSLSLAFEQTIIFIMKYFKIDGIRIPDNYIEETDYLEYTRDLVSPNGFILKIRKDRNNERG